jgi:hypothetical protein
VFLDRRVTPTACQQYPVLLDPKVIVVWMADPVFQAKRETPVTLVKTDFLDYLVIKEPREKPVYPVFLVKKENVVFLDYQDQKVMQATVNLAHLVYPE